MHIGATGERTHTHITRRVMTPEVAFDDLEYTFDVEFDAKPQRYLILCSVVSGVVHLTSEGRTETFGPGDLFLSLPDLPSAGVVRAARLRQLTLDPVVLTRVASSVAGETTPVRVLGRRPVSRQAALQLRRSVGYVRHSVLDPPDRRRRQGRLRHAPRAATRVPAPPGHHPLGHLRRVRLAHAREDLLAATAGDGNTVTVIAGRWGFPSPSRFAEEYRAAYGELPSRTLRA